MNPILRAILSISCWNVCCKIGIDNDRAADYSCCNTHLAYDGIHWSRWMVTCYKLRAIPMRLFNNQSRAIEKLFHLCGFQFLQNLFLVAFAKVSNHDKAANCANLKNWLVKVQHLETLKLGEREREHFCKLQKYTWDIERHYNSTTNKLPWMKTFSTPIEYTSY